MKINIKKRFPFYKGVDILIPGHMYKEAKSNQVFLFIGFGRFNLVYGNETDRFIYLNKNKMENLIKKGLLSPDLKTYNYTFLKNPFISDVFNKSVKPRLFIEDLGAFFNECYIDNLKIEVFEKSKRLKSPYQIKFIIKDMI